MRCAKNWTTSSIKINPTLIRWFNSRSVVVVISPLRMARTLTYLCRRKQLKLRICMRASPLAPAKMSSTKRCMRVPQARRMIAKMSPVFRPYHKKSWKLWSRRITPTWRSPLKKISMSKKTRVQQCFTKSKTRPSSMKKMLTQTQIVLTQVIAHRLTQ